MARSQLHHHNLHYIVRHAVLFFVGILAAVVLIQSGVLDFLLESSKSITLLAAFIGGFFFTSLFTVAPATVLLFELGQAGTLGLVPMAIIGGIGALLGDLILFRLIKSNITDELAAHFKDPSAGYFKKLMRIKLFSFAVAVAGALVIVLPLPDELGLAMLNMAKIRPKHIGIISFFLNGSAIFMLGLVARGI